MNTTIKTKPAYIYGYKLFLKEGKMSVELKQNLTELQQKLLHLRSYL
jgi:hypothetical protein